MRYEFCLISTSIFISYQS